MGLKKALAVLGGVCVGLICAVLLVEAGLRIYKYALVNKNLRPLPKADHSRVILSLGESTTYGFLVPPDKNYSRLLERDLNSAYPGAGFRVLNLGYPAAISGDIRALCDSALAVYQPMAVLACLGDNDMGFTVNYKLRGLCLPKPASSHPFSLDPKGVAPATDGGFLLWKVIKAHHQGKIYDWTSQEKDMGGHWTMVIDREKNPRYYYYNLGPNAPGGPIGWLESEKKAIFSNLEKNILAMNEKCARQKIPFILVGYMASEINDYLKKWAGEHGIPYVNNEVGDWSVYEKLVIQKGMLGRKDMFHPNAAGHAYMEANILKKLEQTGCLPRPGQAP